MIRNKCIDCGKSLEDTEFIQCVRCADAEDASYGINLDTGEIILSDFMIGRYDMETDEEYMRRMVQSNPKFYGETPEEYKERTGYYIV